MVNKWQKALSQDGELAWDLRLWAAQTDALESIAASLEKLTHPFFVADEMVKYDNPYRPGGIPL